ncbi:MAG: hypothetical protein L0241_04035 [Planctomycetia bacterium]|nr:hypothetical protein [Planctomycetia bacterium]
MIHKSARCWGQFALLFCCVALVSGCGKSSSAPEVSGVTVRGRLVSNGAALKLLPDEQIRVSFVDVNGTKDSQIAASSEYDPGTDTFEITGPSGKGIPPGEYRVEIVSEIYGGDGTNRFEELFDAEITPFLATVGAEEGQEFIIDIGKKTLTKR